MKYFLYGLFFALFAGVVFIGCEQEVNDSPDLTPSDDTPITKTTKTIEIHNESSVSISDIKWNGETFTGGEKVPLQTTLAPASTFTRVVSGDKAEDDIGYIYFTKSTNNLVCRTFAVSFEEADSFIFTDNTLVVELADTANRAPLQTIAKLETTLSIKNVSGSALTAVRFSETDFDALNSGASATHGITTVEGIIFFSKQIANTNVVFKVKETPVFTLKTQNSFTITKETVVTEIATDRTGPLMELIATITAEIPAAPADIAATSLSATSIQLTWMAVPGTASYRIYRSDSSTGDYKCIATPQGTETSYTNNELPSSMTYWYKITSLKNSYEGAYSDALSQTTLPTIPSGVSLALGSGRLMVSWTAVDRASSYNVYYGESTTPPVNPAQTNITGTSATITGLSNEQAYYVWVQAANGFTNSPLSIMASKRLTLRAPTVPTLTAGSGKLTVSWTAVDTSDSYNVYHSTTTTAPAIPTKNVSGTSAVITGLSNGTPSYVWVQAVNEGGSSALSPVASKTLLLGTPTAPALTTGDGKLMVSWPAIELADLYNVYHSTTETVPATPTINVTKPIAVITGLSNEQNYYVWVQAVNLGGVSALSAKSAGMPVNTYTVNTAAAFNQTISNINADTEDGSYTINVNGNFAARELTFTASGNKTITIKGDSANRSISNDGTTVLFTITSGITLELDNNITLNGNTERASVVGIETGGILTMKTGSTITGATAHGVYIDGGTLNMSGGTISGNSAYASFYSSFGGSGAASSSYGGGVFIASGTFTMSGGTISGNSASQYTDSSYYAYSYGGGVFIASGTFTMSGGTISGNSTTSYSYSYGGGVYVNTGRFIMSGGTISGNSTNNYSTSDTHNYGGGVYVASGGIFTKTGGTIAATNLADVGKVAYVYSGSKKRNTTAGPGVNLNSGTSGSAGGWE